MNRVRNPTMSSGYPQQGYQVRPPNNYGPSMQQPNYGYAQAGAYPGQPAQYNISQTPYSGYPPQPTSGGYANATVWDQSTAPQNQQTPHGVGYDYYNHHQQQQPPQQQQTHGCTTPPSDGSGYNYSQAPAYSQGQVYNQDSYGNYHVQSGYDQQQQGYNNNNYGNVSNPTPDGPTNSSYGAQGEANQAPPSGHLYNNAGGQNQPAANPNYPPQGGYGAQAPAGYGPPQPQKPPGGQAVYAQPPPPQGQPGYAVSQPAYGAPPYGAPPAAQPGYVQYQQAPTYNSSYGGGYGQPPAYSSDATPPAPQSGQAGGPAKASPSS